MSQRCFIHSGETKAWFSYVGKIPDDRGFYFFPTIPDFADISDMRQRSVPDFPDYELFICDRGTGAQQFRGLVMSEIHRWWTLTVKILKFSFVGNDRRPSQKSGTRRENRNAPDYPDIYWDIYDFEFSLVGKIRDDGEKVKSQTFRNFHDIWKPGLRVFSRCTKGDSPSWRIIRPLSSLLL